MQHAYFWTGKPKGMMIGGKTFMRKYKKEKNMFPPSAHKTSFDAIFPGEYR